jgi:hypothetical protein
MEFMVTMTAARLALPLVAVAVVVSGCSSFGSPSGTGDRTGGVDLERPAATVVGPTLVGACPLSGSPEIPDSYLPVSVEGNRTGDGITVAGYVIAAGSCRGVANARVDFWHAGPDGKYQPDKFRSITWTTSSGTFDLSLTKPGVYETAPSHVHILVTAEGFLPRSFSIRTDSDQSGQYLVIEPGTGV